MNTPKLKLNKEQTKAVKHGSGPLLIIAGAGTGKTTVITERVKYLIAKKEVDPSEILALTFTEKASTEMETRIDQVMPYGYTQMWVMTFHSFCDRILRDQALHIGLNPKFRLMTKAESIQLVRKNIFDFNLDYFRPMGNPDKFIFGMLQHFSRLTDEDINPDEYLSWTRKIKIPKNEEEKLELKKWKELSNAYKKYEELKIENDLMDFGDLISKTLHLFRKRSNILSEYKKKFKYILVDEFQDTNFAQNELVKLLVGKKGNITAVADDDQCLPGGSKISTLSGDKNIKDIKIGDEIITAIGKGHTSLSRVSKVFKRSRKSKFLVFKTKGGRKIKVTDNHKMFCFLPGYYKLKNWHFVYIMYSPKYGWRIGVTNNLSQRIKFERQADKIIGIGSYKTDAEARFYEAYYSAKYGIPTVPFSARPKQAISGKFLDKLFKDIDSRKNVEKLAKDLKIELDSPQFMPGATTRGATKRVKVNFEMCSRNYRSKSHKDGFVGSPWVMHQVTLETSNRKSIRLLESKDIKLLKTKTGKRLRRNFVDIKKAWRFAVKLQRITGGIIDKKFSVGRYNYAHLPSRIVPAAHVFPGMFLPVLKGRSIFYEEVVSREEEVKTLTTYDLEIEKTHNFIADGVVVHNSIYRFRGASVSNVIQFRLSFPKTKVIVLNKNYRSSQKILDKSYDLIQHNNPDRLEVVENINKKLIANNKYPTSKVEFIHTGRVELEADGVVKKINKLVQKEKYKYGDFAILVRANNHADPFIKELDHKGIPNQFLGPGKLFQKKEIVELISYLKVLNSTDDSISFYKVLSMNNFYISGFDISKLSVSARKKYTSLFEVAEKSKNKKIKKVVKMIKNHHNDLKNQTPGQVLYNFLETTGILKDLLKVAENEVRAINISKFFEKIKTLETKNSEITIEEVVDWIDLSLELGESPLAANTDWTKENVVNILTIHSAKGLEFPVVFLVNLVNLRFPSMNRKDQIPIPDGLIKEILPQGDFHIQEERRLFYVAMTRAKEKLFLTASDLYGEGKKAKKISPFVYEALGKNIDTKKLNKKESIFYSTSKKVNKKVRTKTKVDYLSYSQIETFKVCPLHYKLRYLYKIPMPQSASASFGISIHETLKDFYKSVKKGDKPNGKVVNDLLKINWVRGGFKNKKYEKEYFEKGKVYLSKFLKEGFDKKTTPELLEERFVLPISKNLKVVGTIDRVDVLQNGQLEIIDYKTGVKIPTQREVDKNLQLSIYALAASQIPTKPFGEDPKDIKLSLYFLSEQKKLTTTRTKKQLEDAKKEILKVRDEIEESSFRCSNHYFCQNNCEFSMFCKSEN